MKHVIYIVVVFSFAGLLLSCSRQELPPVEYVNWIKNAENGLRKSKEIDNYIIDVQYKPVDYVIANELRKETITKEEYQQKLQEFKGMDYFTLKLDVKNTPLSVMKYGLQDEAQYQQRVQYFSFDMQRDIKLVSDNDTIPCSLYHFERSYDLGKHRNFVLGFAKSKTAEAATDKMLVMDYTEFGLGIIKIKFDEDDLEDIPLIALKK